MQVVAFSSPRSGHDGRDAELQQFERLAGTLSSQFARLHVEEIAPAILGALEQVGLAIDVQACALIEFTEGAIGAMHTWPSAAVTFGDELQDLSFAGGKFLELSRPAFASRAADVIGGYDFRE